MLQSSKAILFLNYGSVGLYSLWGSSFSWNARDDADSQVLGVALAVKLIFVFSVTFGTKGLWGWFVARELFEGKRKGKKITKNIEELNQQPPESQPHTLPLLYRNTFAVVNINNHSCLPHGTLPCNQTVFFFFLSHPCLDLHLPEWHLPDGHLPEGSWCFWTFERQQHGTVGLLGVTKRWKSFMADDVDVQMFKTASQEALWIVASLFETNHFRIKNQQRRTIIKSW